MSRIRSLAKRRLKLSVQCQVFAQLLKEDCKTFCPMSRIRPSYQKKTKTFCPVSRIRPHTIGRLKRPVQCHVFAHLPKEDRQTLCPVSRIRPFTK